MLLPGTGIDFFLHMGTPFQVQYLDDGSIQHCPVRHVLCVRRRSIRILADASAAFLAVRIRAGMFRHLIPLPMEDLFDRVIPAGEIWGAKRIEPLRRVSGTVDVTTVAIKQLDDFFMNCLRSCRCKDPWLDGLCSRLYYEAESRIERIAEQAGVSRRHMERQFKQSYGITPKRFQRISRLQHTVRDIVLNGRDPLDCALDRGYYDQAHFIHDVRGVTGQTPSALMRSAEDMSLFYNPSKR